MTDPRWPPWLPGGEPPPGGLAPPWATFTRSQNGAVALQEFEHGFDRPRVLGTEPVAPAAPKAPRRRNTSNSSVYVIGYEQAIGRRGRGVSVPVVGEIAAGQYDVTVALHDYLEYEHQLKVDPDLMRASTSAFALRVRGTSMTHVGIDPGDLVVVQPIDKADNGDLVVACLTDSDSPEGYVTLKRYYRKGSHIFLQSATADKSPIRLYPHGAARGDDRDRVKIQGRVIVVIKCANS
ncbi:MAG: LexA family protein [Chloroflexia bacterium]